MSLRSNGIEKTDPDLPATDGPIICRDAAELLEAIDHRAWVHHEQKQTSNPSPTAA
jgi:hypothetical protein